VRVGEATVLCPGSTERTAFSEAGQTKGYARWSLAGDRGDWRFVDLPTRALRVVKERADLDGVEPGDVVRCSARWEREVRARGAFCRLERAQLPLFGASPRSRGDLLRAG
jgi:DNA repair exonuclease SbcCD nuclease subunit